MLHDLNDGNGAQAAAAELRVEDLALFERVQRMVGHYATGFGHASEASDAASGLKIEVLTPEEAALPVRASIGAGVIRLPPAALSADPAAATRLYQASVAHAVAHLRYSRPASPVGKRGALWVAVASLIEDARVERLLMGEYPGLHRLWGGFHTVLADGGVMSFASLAARLARALHYPDFDDTNHWVMKGRDLVEELAGCPDNDDAYAEVASILAVDLAQMRVRFDFSTYYVEPAYRDDNAYLWRLDEDSEPEKPEPTQMKLADQSALEHRSNDQPAKNDEATREAEEVRCHRYPEWHARVGAEFAEWTSVFDRSPAQAPGHAERSAPSRRPPPPWWQEPVQRLRRQFDGDDFDLSALIDAQIGLRARIASHERVFQRQRRRRATMSVLLLLDFSESTNDRAKAGEPSMLDIEKEVATTIATARSPAANRLALHGFASNGRHQVHYSRIKDFDEPFGAVERQRLQAQRGAFSTRMGAAMRHAATCLESETTDAKVLILVSDGAPSDIDVHDTSHLVEDARHAVAELSSRGILTFCFALDRDARHARTIFGRQRYMLMERATNLAVQISRLLENLLR
ncbi:nitric oxide reductase activation protein NorD [Paraburkholderia rhynchosiae]|nr:VWA domain-containing protein [Paraburkholderia rhynchosiae]